MQVQNVCYARSGLRGEVFNPLNRGLTQLMIITLGSLPQLSITVGNINVRLAGLLAHCVWAVQVQNVLLRQVTQHNRRKHHRACDLK